jgi:hypothetical protein
MLEELNPLQVHQDVAFEEINEQNTNPVQPHKAILEECNCKPSKTVHPLSPLEQSHTDPHLPQKVVTNHK